MKKYLLLIFIILLLATGCKNNQDNDDTSKNTNETNQATTEFEDIYWREDLVAIGFLGYNQYDSLHIYSESQEFYDYLEFFFPSIEEFEIIDVGGDELYFLIPRFKDSNLAIRNTDFKEDNDFIEKEFFNGKAKPILLQTNASDLYPDTEISIEHNNKEVYFYPSLNGIDSTIILPEFGVQDISMYNIVKDEGLYNNIYLLEGSWHCEYNNSKNEKNTIDFQFENFQFTEEDDWYEMIYWRQNPNQELKGNCYFRVPVDFWESIDDEEILLYFDLAGENNGELEQLFGKFRFEFIDSNTLIIEHVGYDPLNKGEENYIYEFIRTFG